MPIWIPPTGEPLQCLARLTTASGPPLTGTFTRAMMAPMSRRSDRFALAVARAALPLLALVTLVLGTGCRTATPATVVGAATPGRETVITQAEIARMSVTTAWDVVRLRAPRLVVGRDAAGRPAGVRIQERRSVNADETPLLVVDGVHMLDLSYLEQLPASEIALIRILDAEAAYPLYGLRAAGGAIVVQTKSGR